MTAALIDALTELGGLTITVRHDLEAASQRLMDTLGVTVVVDPSAPECTRFEGSYSHAIKPGGCAKCARIDRLAA